MSVVISFFIYCLHVFDTQVSLGIYVVVSKNGMNSEEGISKDVEGNVRGTI
jgi:hypothetical protein